MKIKTRNAVAAFRAARQLCHVGRDPPRRAPVPGPAEAGTFKPGKRCFTNRGRFGV
jgi:hypothetical protein